MRAACRAFRAWPDGWAPFQHPSLFQSESSKFQPPTSRETPTFNNQKGTTSFYLVIGISLEPIRLSLRAGFGGWSLELGIWCFLWTWKGYVYFSTSSIVVSPAKMLRNPSWRSVTIPNSIAFCFKTTVGAR